LKDLVTYQFPGEMPCAMFTIEIQTGKFSNFSPYFFDLTGHQPDYFMVSNARYEGIIHQDYIQGVFIERIKYISKSKDYVIAYPIFNKKGHQIWVKEMGAPLKDKDGVARKYAVLLQETDSLNHKVNRLEQIRSIVRKAHTAGMVGVYYYDMFSGKIHWSSQLKSILGVKKEPTVEEYWSYIHPDDLELHKIETANMINEKGSVNRFMRMFRQSDGKLLYIVTGGTAVEDENGVVIGAAGTVVDITDIMSSFFTVQGAGFNDVKDQLQQIKTIEESPFFMKSENKLVSVKPEEIIYIQAMGDYMKIKVKSRDLPFIVHMTLKKAEDALPENMFFQPHRSYLVNLKMVELIDKNGIAIAGIHIPLSKSRKKELLQRIQNFTA
jgi:PAS domain S-box-containing protein